MKLPKATSAGVDTVFDALHGNIDFSDIDVDTKATITGLISAPFMRRLRRIKQLGFVSQNFLSAEHNRYSHALGTLHVMRKLIERVALRGRVLHSALPAVRNLAGKKRIPPLEWLKQHMLVAALVQDVGELPYEQAASGIFLPGTSIKTTVDKSLIDLDQLKNKHIFTLYFIWDDDSYHTYFNGLDRTVLTFLISGLVAGHHTITNELLALRQMLDGSIDADRIDYVYRDAFHTIGVRHNSGTIIESVEDYDQKGPSLSHVRPAVDFIITRAMLWSNVYLSPENRFRVILLRVVLQEMMKNATLRKMVKLWKPQETTPERFLALHDVFIDNLVGQIARDLDVREEVAIAVKLLRSGSANYDYKWVPFGLRTHDQKNFSIAPPPGFYYDSYEDYQERKHTLFDNKSVRIIGDRYEFVKSGTYLEDCIGPFCNLLKGERWRAEPMPEHMTWFVPRPKPTDGAWPELFRLMDTHQLTTFLRLADPLTGVEFVPDTRTREECQAFAEPAIFLAFEWDDKELAKRLAGLLFGLRRHYFVLLEDFVGMGKDTPTLSEEAVDRAGAAIILVSRQYIEKYKDLKGPINREITRMRNRSHEIPIVCLGLDEFKDIEAGLPYTDLTRNKGTPFVGSRALRKVSVDLFRDAVSQALKYIDTWKPLVAR